MANRIAVVTGATSGLGDATCSALEADGDWVIRVDLAGCDVNADLTDANGRNEAIRKIAELAPQRIDAVVTWAGGGGSSVDMLRVNYFGTVDIVEGLYPLLAESRAPRVVVTSSRMSLEVCDEALVDLLLTHRESDILEQYGAENTAQSYYIAAKTAVARWMRRTTVQPKWNGPGIRMNAIAPGLIETPRTRKGMDAPHIAAWLLETHPQAEADLSQAAEVALLARFLVSPENSLLIGQCIFADRGTEALLRGDTVW